MRAFDEIAEEWNAYRRRPFPALKFFLPHLQQDDVALDAGCGNGRNLPAIAGKCREAYGLDSSPKMVGFAREMLNRSKSRNAAVLDGDILQMPFQDGFFDAVFCIAAFHHFNAREQKMALAEMRRVLKKGGKLFMTVWAGKGKRGGEKEYAGREDEKMAGETLQGMQEWMGKWAGGGALVGWKKRDGSSTQRYYYFFRKPELEKIVKAAGFSIRKIFWERGGRIAWEEGAANLCLIAAK